VEGQRLYAQYYPVHATVQWSSPQSPYLSDYYSGSRDRLIVTLLNRDLQQPLLFAKLRIRIKSTGFLASSREEGNYPILELNANVPTRLTNIDLAPYLQPQNLQTNGNLRNGQLPVGYTEFSVQVIDYYTGRALSDWHSGRSYLDVKKPPLLNFPEKDAQIGITEPLYIGFQWMPRHQGLAGTEYEFVLKELPDNGAAPQSAFAYGNEIYRIRTRNTTLTYTHLEPILFPNRRYAWQVQAIARGGVDEVGMFENGGFSEINWFYLNDNCQAPTGLKALPRFAKVELSWNKVIGTTGYVVECRPKTKLNVYEWSSTRVAGEYLTLAQLKPGWTYEWRVGTLCTDDRPVFSDVHEFMLSSQNDELLADCGKEPVRPDLSQDPNLRIKAGDIVTIGGDYPMTIIEAVSLGDGWYSGRGKTRLKTIIDAPVSLRFDRLRINVDNFQIDGTVEASYDEKKAKIANLDYIDDGGKDIKPATIRMREYKMGFMLPDIPQFIYNHNTGELETTDAEGNPQTIKIDVPENASYDSIFPMLVTDNKGNTYQISPSKQSTEGTTNGVENENKNEKIELNCEHVDRVDDFNMESLSSKYGYIHFERGEGKYAFDDGQEKWYKKSVKVDRFYKPFAKGYIAPWKLVPVGENDIVMAKYDGLKNIDLKKVRFVSEPNSAALPARLNETEQTWTITLKSVSAGASYDVFAVYEGVVIGKLCVVSYDKHQHKITLVPINEVKLDKIAIEQGLNTIYNPVGVQFSVDIDESMRGNYDWEVESEKDGLLSTVGKSFWGYDKELKESTEMLNLQKTYQQAAGTLDGAYLFVLNGATGLEGQKGGLLGEMPRKSRFGYIFAGNSPNTEEIVHTIAHELGHGIFTLQHTFDAEYGKDTQGTTNNLLDYKDGTDIAAFQWNVMANPAVFTAMDKAKDGEINLKKGEYLGFTPDGRVIQKRPKEYAGIFDNDTSYFIYKFKDKNGSFYTWTGKNYTNDKGETFEVPDIPVTGKVAVWANSKNPDCYVWYKFIHVKNYTSKDFDKIKKQINVSTTDEWIADYVSGAKPDCIEKATEEKSHGILLSSINIGEDNKKNTIDCNGNQNQLDLLKPLLDKVNKVTSSYSASETNKILEENYSPCLFEHIGIEKRIVILNNLLSGDDSNWEFSGDFNIGDRFFLDHLVNSTPEKDRVRLLKDGFMANNYKWLEILWNYSTGFWNNDVTTSDIIPLIGDLSEWVKAYYNQLSIPITTKTIDGIGVPGFSSYEYPVASVNPICLGVPDDGSTAFYTTNVGNLPYALEIYKKPSISISDGKFHFAQYFFGRLQGQVVTQAGKTVLQEIVQDRDLGVSPFEPVVLIASRNYRELGIVSGQEYIVPAFVAAIYQQSLNDNASEQTLRSICNGIAITAAVLTAPYTAGGSWAAYTTVAAGFVAGVDEALKEGRLQLGKSDEYDSKYASFYDAWNVLYNTTLAIDALANVPQVVIRSIRSLDLIISTKNVYQNAKTSKLATKFEELWKSGKSATSVVSETVRATGKHSLASISKEHGFIDMLPELLKKEGITEEEFVNYTNYIRKELPYTPRAQIARLRNSVPSPTAETVMQKVIPASDLEKYISGQYDKIQGFMTKAADTKYFKSFDDFYYGLRLDYDGTKFFLDEGCCYAIRFKSKEVPLNIIVPRGRDFKDPYPFTSHGFTAGIKGRIGVPEFTIPRDPGVSIENGTEIWKITRDGKQTLYAVFKEGKFIVIK
jgi:fibronectin type III domain protein